MAAPRGGPAAAYRFHSSSTFSRAKRPVVCSSALRAVRHSAIPPAGLPGAITSLALGAAAAALGLFQHDETIALLATFGIVALFLFAGLDVDLEELRPGVRVLLQHLAIWIVTLVLLSVAVTYIFSLAPRDAGLVALALITPSTGFILDSLELFGLSDDEKRWTKSKAIASELLALCMMFLAPNQLPPVSWVRASSRWWRSS